MIMNTNCALNSLKFCYTDDIRINSFLFSSFLQHTDFSGKKSKYIKVIQYQIWNTFILFIVLLKECQGFGGYDIRFGLLLY